MNDSLRRLAIDQDSKISNLLSHAINYKFSMWKELKKMSHLISKGHEIKWSPNERWCIINGETFNITKSVYEKRLLENELEETFTEYFWNEGRPIQFACNYDAWCEGEIIFDYSVEEVDLKKLDEFLSMIAEKNNK